MRKALSSVVALVALATALFVPGIARAERPVQGAFLTNFDTYSPGSTLRDTVKPVDLSTVAPLSRMHLFAQSRATAVDDPPIGTSQYWLYYNDVAGGYGLTLFTLRELSPHTAIWVQNNLKFPTGDCRNDYPSIVNVTDGQLNYLAQQFETNMLPKESDAFTVAPAHDGSGALLPPAYGDYRGDGNRTVILISNVRDSNYYDTNNAHANSYIAGLFSSTINAYTDRNVMTIDSYDWLHRTTSTPPDDSATSTLCNPGRPRPNLYEGTFAHEYQHLLEHYSDSDEVNWINEGLSDWAMSLTGYAHPELNRPDPRADSHIQTFLGAFPPDAFGRHGGPENSLTGWGDQGGGEILADYGAAYSMMTYLNDHYGHAFMSALHRDPGNGFTGLQDVLSEFGQSKVSALGTMNTWAQMLAVDGLIDGGARILGPFRESAYTSTNLNSFINWTSPDAYDSPGAPFNGSDYVQLRDAAGNALSGRNIGSLSFSGASTLPSKPLLWTSVVDAPGHAGDAALYSGAGNYRDAAAIRPVTVNGGTLTFDALWNEEPGWDFGFVQISTDGAATWHSLACTDTTSDHDPDALPTAVANVPGFTDYSGGWRPESCSLAGYSGNVLLAFRTYNDPATLGADSSVPPGFWVDNVTIGSTLISDGSDISAWKSQTQVRPTSVENFVVTIMSVNGKKITLEQLPLNTDFAVKNAADVQKYIDKNASFVGAIVTYDDPSETSDQYAPYKLTVNGVVQPGGGT